MNSNNINNRRTSTALSPREIKRFVAVYRKHELLWNSKCPQYTSPTARSEALASISEEMGKMWNESLVKSKWNQLKSQYRRELGKLSETGSSEGDTPASRWWLFGLMDSFLRQHTTLRNGSNGSSYTFPIESLKMEDVSSVPSYETVDDTLDNCIESGGSLDGCLEPEESENVMLLKEPSPVEREETSCFSISSVRNFSMGDMANNSSSSTNSNPVLDQSRNPDEMFTAWLYSELAQIDDEYVKDELKIELMRKCNEAKRTCRLRNMQSVSHLNRPSFGSDHHMGHSLSPQLSVRPLGPPSHSTQINRTT